MMGATHPSCQGRPWVPIGRQGSRNSIHFGSVNILLAEEGGFTVEMIEDENDIRQAFKLRHLLFAEILRWVPEKLDGLEIDEHDRWARMIGLFSPKRQLIGIARLHDSGSPFMIEREFAGLTDTGGRIPKGPQTAEISRLGLHPEARSHPLRTPYGQFDLFTLLFKGFHRWCTAFGIDCLYGVIDQRMGRCLRSKGFPIEAICKPRIMPDGVIAQVVSLEWPRFETQNRGARPGLHAWFT